MTSGTGCGAPRVHARSMGTRADIGAPPGTTTSPCQELADDLGTALKAWRPNLKRGPVFAKSPQMSMRFGVRGSLRYALKQREARVAHSK